MKILIIVRRYPVISQTFIRLHVESLEDLGHDVTVMAESGDSICQDGTECHSNRALDRIVPLAYPSGSLGKRVGDLVRQLSFDFRSLRLLILIISDYIRGRSAGAAVAAIPFAAVLRQVGPWDIVHVHFGNLALPVAQLCEVGYIKAPVIVTFHGTDLNEERKVPNFQLFARVFRTAQLLTVGTKHMAEHLEECNIPVEKYKVIPMGIDLSRFNPHERNQKRRICSGTRLITIGRLVEFKGVEYAIRAVAELHKTCPDVTLDVIGEGHLRTDLERLCQELNIASAVRFHGALGHEKVLALLEESDIYLQPGIIAADGTREGQGVAVAEAQAMGLPVVASRVGGIPEIVAEGESAYLVEPKDVSELVEKISHLIRDPELRERMGAAGQVFVEQSLNQKVLANRWVVIYHELIAVSPKIAIRS